MNWVSTVSEEPSLEKAVPDAVGRIRKRLGNDRPNLVVVFVSEHYSEEYTRLPQLISEDLGEGLLIGCSAGGVIGGGREVEQRPGLSVTAAVLPNVELVPFCLETQDMPEPAEGPKAWEALLHVSRDKNPHFLLLPDPFSFDADRFVMGLDQAFPESNKIGGLASGGREPGFNALYLGKTVHHSGLVGVAMMGDIDVDTIVAQGCRPIGTPMFVTRCWNNVLQELDGEAPVHLLQKLFETLDASDKELFRHALFLGIVMKESQREYRQGDFLIRNILGMDPETGAVAIGAKLKENLVVQFHLRDAVTSTEDLEELLSRYQGGSPIVRPEGSLLFSCLGRGISLYGRPDHDTDLFRRHLGEIPLGGFFCNGEIGPVHGTTFLHGYTSSFGLFRRKT
ncbi:MAG: FIST C-terminal domain-containing protein [Deltaproteobacteria bacterium]|nr:FIST C-terminal domain-containing protein [Deltaproteobacteria bacterium]